MVCESFVQPLSLQCLFLNKFAGSIEIFIGLAIFFISAIAAKFRLPNEIFLIMLVVFGILMWNVFAWFIILIILLVAFIVFYSISNIVKR